MSEQCLFSAFFEAHAQASLSWSQVPGAQGEPGGAQSPHQPQTLASLSSPSPQGLVFCPS